MPNICKNSYCIPCNNTCIFIEFWLFVDLIYDPQKIRSILNKCFMFGCSMFDMIFNKLSNVFCYTSIATYYPARGRNICVFFVDLKIAIKLLSSGFIASISLLLMYPLSKPSSRVNLILFFACWS